MAPHEHGHVLPWCPLHSFDPSLAETAVLADKFDGSDLGHTTTNHRGCSCLKQRCVKARINGFIKKFGTRGARYQS
jgi:hypothetical protein